MAQFATVDESARCRHPVLVWEHADGRQPKVIARHVSRDVLPDDMDVFKFDIPTTAGIGGCNEGRYPVVDTDGSPLWNGARIKFVVPTHHVNRIGGIGTFKTIDLYGGSSFVSDTPINIYDRGVVVTVRREQYENIGSFEQRQDHELRGYRVLEGKLGDPFEHGESTVFIKLISDPRDVCSPMCKVNFDCRLSR